MSISSKPDLPRLAIFGAGGLGVEMLALLNKRPCAHLVALVDKTGFLYDPEGIELTETYLSMRQGFSIEQLSGAKKSSSAIADYLTDYADRTDAIFYALPNLPNEFIPDITQNLVLKSDFKGVIVDALKRTRAVKLLGAIDEDLRRANILYLTGCGATPGLLTAAAALAAQSFVKIEKVEITFGVGIKNWQAYRATIREDIAHLAGFSVEQVAGMTEAEIDAELEKRNGILELVNMEHADDIMLEWAGICPAECVSVGGVVDTRHPQKPLSTNVKVTGITYQAELSTHTFTLGDETTMACNVNGTVLGYLNAAYALHKRYNASGLMTAVEIMPSFRSINTKVNAMREIPSKS
ncbi:MAG: hypothetical protein SFT81_04620 [Candidatus Caenarcaniphilales bacterium]|nr:hypothetical protein [Candidatus Caenarcaniphilales bacterium]